jgi:predicted dehydrogenase
MALGKTRGRVISTNKKTGFAITGLASHHSEFVAHALRNIPETLLLGAYDDDEARGVKFCEKFHIKFFRDLDALLSDPRVDVGVVTSENARKRNFSIAVANAGKHVICDKPLGITAQESREIIDSCKRNDVTLQVGYVSRYVKEVQRARHFAMSGRLGEVKFINAENRVDSGLVKQLSPWLLDREQSGGGALLEHSVHAIDLALWFNESLPHSVYAVSSENMDSSYEVEDNFAIMLRFENESLALIDGSYCRPSSGRRGDVVVNIAGSRCQLDFAIANPELKEYLGAEPKIEFKGYQSRGVSSEEASGERMIEDFLRCLKTGSEPLTNGKEAEEVNAVVDASYKSIASGHEILM